MKLLFLLLNMPDDESSSDMYTDLINEFRDNGHIVTVIAPSNHNKTGITIERSVNVLRVKVLQTLGVRSMIKKGVGLALLPYFFKRAYKRFLKGEKFDWIFMPTPPITLIDFVVYVKTRINVKFYLILRDIHPQSSASIGLIKNRMMFNYLATRAEKGYKIADFIGCMSQGNIDYIANNYPELDKNKLVLLMNWQKDVPYKNSVANIRLKFNLQHKFVALFGGNIGLGQKIENIADLAKHYLGNKDIVFVLIGKGVAKERLQKIAVKQNLDNIRFVDFMPRSEYLDFVKSVNLGLISINENYKVPTCPSKSVSYMSLKIPVFAMINSNNDYGEIIEKAGAGYWSVGSDKKNVYRKFDSIYSNAELRQNMGEKGYAFYKTNLTSEKAYTTIIEQIDGKEKV